MKTCKNCIYSKIIIPKNTNCPSEFVCSLSDEDFHNCISNDMWHFSSKVLDQPLEDDAINNDLISRGDLINAKPEFMNEKVVRDTKYRTTKDRIYAKAWNACNSYWLNTIKNAPTVEEHQPGVWVAREDMDYLDKNKVVHKHFQCNKCGLVHDFIDGHTSQYNFCPQCGADMKIKNISPDSGIQEFDKKFADLIVFNDQPQRQLKSSDVHEDV